MNNKKTLTAFIVLIATTILVYPASAHYKYKATSQGPPRWVTVSHTHGPQEPVAAADPSPAVVIEPLEATGDLPSGTAETAPEVQLAEETDVPIPAKEEPDLFKATGDSISGTVDAAGDSVSGTVDAAGDSIWGTVDAAGDSIWGTVDAAGDSISGTVDAVADLKLFEAAGDMLWGTVDAAGETVNAVFAGPED